MTSNTHTTTQALPTKSQVKASASQVLSGLDQTRDERVQEAFTSYFAKQSLQGEPQSVSEDFSYIPDEWGCPYTFWTLGGFADMNNAPANNSPHFAPDLQPTLDRGFEAAVVAALAWLAN